jgi:hypothetical protein
MQTKRTSAKPIWIGTPRRKVDPFGVDEAFKEQLLHFSVLEGKLSAPK